MSDSDDPRFRIPRGSSDEEIDSDLASITSDPPRANAATRADRGSITAAASTLRATFNDSEARPTEPPIDENASDADDEADEAALSAVTYAATGRRDLTNASAREAREVLPAGEEKEGVVPVVGGGKEGGGQQEMMNRMLGVLGEGEVGGLGALKKKVARVGNRRPLNVPLAEPVADRISRGVVYAEMRDEVTDKWAKVVLENRKKQRLVFPLNGNAGGIGRNSGNVVERFKAENEYEREIHNMLKEAGVADDSAVMKEEEKGLGELKVTKEEIMERRRDMARMRSMMFHYEQKMKRIAKIKSRRYRRILKKEKEKIKEMDRGEGWEEEELVKKERRRAEERMTLRHKNTSKWVRRQLTRGEGKRNENTRAAIEDQLRLHEKLKERQERLMDESEGSESEASVGDGATEQRMEEELEKIREEIEEDGREQERKKRQKRKGLMGMRFMQAAEERQRKMAQDLLEQMGNDGAKSGEEGEAETRHRQGRRSFSGRATNSERTTEKGRGDEITSEFGRKHEETNYSLSEGEEGDMVSLGERISVKEKGELENLDGSVGMLGDEGLGNGKLSEALRNGRQVRSGFTTKLEGRLKADDIAARRDAEKELNANGDDREDSENFENGVEKQEKGPRVDEEEASTFRDGSPDGEGTAESGQACKKQEGTTETLEDIVISGQDRIAVETQAQLGETKGEEGEEGRHENDGRVGTMEDKGPSSQGKDCKRRGRRKRAAKVNFASTVEVEKREGVEVREEWKIGEDSEKQGGIRDEEVSRMRFVAEAFAGAGGADEEEFAALKRDEVERGAPTAKEIGAEVLPGWGRWDGAGMKTSGKSKRGNEREESAFAKAAKERLAAAREKALKGRRDGGLKHVILEERRVKRAAELTLASVPFPFRSAEEWEREVEVPVCREFVSGRGFGDGVRGRVEKRVGAVIEPIRLGKARDQRERRKRKREEEMEEMFDGKRGVLEMRKKKAREREMGRRGLMVGK